MSDFQRKCAEVLENRAVIANLREHLKGIGDGSDDGGPRVVHVVLVQNSYDWTNFHTHMLSVADPAGYFARLGMKFKDGCSGVPTMTRFQGQMDPSRQLLLCFMRSVVADATCWNVLETAVCLVTLR